MPTLFIIGDTDGHDKICGRMVCRGNISHLCRYCDIHKDNIDNSFASGNLITMEKIKKMSEKKDFDGLKNLSMHCIKNAWHDVQFSDKKRGLHGSVPPEVLHCIQLGIHKYLITELFMEKKDRTVLLKRKFAEISTQNDEEIYDPSKNDLSNQAVFSKKYLDKFESLCRRNGKNLSRQSDRNLP